VDPLKTETYVTTAQAARLLCLTTATIRNLIRDGRLRGELVGRDYRVELSSVDEEFARRYPEYVRKVEE